MSNMCSSRHAGELNTNLTTNINHTFNDKLNSNGTNFNQAINSENHDFFSINGDRLEIFGIIINIDDLIILIMLFFMFRENQIDYSIIIILALILFDQN